MIEDERQPRARQRLTRDERREETRDRLLDAAADVFNRLGYHGASLDAVAEAAGYTKGAVYSNFATKADLFLALLGRYASSRARAQGEAITAYFDRFLRRRDPRGFENQGFNETHLSHLCGPDGINFFSSRRPTVLR